MAINGFKMDMELKQSHAVPAEPEDGVPTCDYLPGLLSCGQNSPWANGPGWR